MPPQKFGGGHEDFQREMDALRRLRGEAEATSRAEQQVVRETERATEAERTANRQRVDRNRLERENAEAAERQRTVRGVKPEADIASDTAAIRENTRARRENADAMTRQAAEARRLQAARERESLIARGAAAGTLQVLPVAAAAGAAAGAATRYSIRETTTGRPVSGAFASQEAAQRRLAQLMQENLTAQQAITAAALERARNERALVVQGARELAARVTATRAIEHYGELVNAEAAGEGERALGAAPGTGVSRRPGYTSEYAWRRAAGLPPGGEPPGGLPPGEPPYRQIPYRGELIRHPELFGQGDYGPNYKVGYGGPGVVRERGGGSTLYSSEQVAGSAKAADAAFHANERLAGSEARAAAASRQAAVEFGTANQMLYKHGALTSEFVQAAYRGEVTLRDLGNQVALTIGKFAGWTVAATLVYGAVRAVGQLGHGAIESNRAVAELGRYINGLDTQRARQQIRDLAREMNLPIEVVAKQFEASARLTGDTAAKRGPRAAQDQAQSIARTTLLLSRVGDLDPDVAQKYTAALTTGFRLSSKELAGVIDGLNQLQNKMNIPFDVSAQASATAAGTVRAAGGTPEVLNALVAAARRGSGFSGQILGTTFSRAATMIGRPSNRAALTGFGIDPDQTFDEIFRQAMHLTQTHQVKGRDIIRLATALSSPQLAGRGIAAALQNPALFKEAIQQQGPQSKGSAERELHQMLKAVDEQIRRIGVNLANLGSALEQSGVLIPLGLMVKLLNLGLGTTVKIVEAFDKLPSALRVPLVLIAEMAAGMALMQRAGAFRAGGALTARFPNLSILDSPDARLKGLIVRGSREQLDFANASREGAARNYAAAAFREEAHVSTLANFRRDYNARKRAGTLPEPDTTARVRLDEKMAAAEAEIKASEDRLAAMKRETLASQRYVLRAQQELTEAQALTTAEARRYAVVNEIPFPASNRHPDPTGAQFLPRIANREGEHGSPVDVLTYMKRAEEEMGLYAPATHELSSFNKGAQDMGKRIRGWSGEVSVMGRSIDTSSVAVRGGQRMVARTVESAGRARDSAARMATSLRGMSSGFGELAAALGPLDYALIGIPVAIELGDAIRNSVNKHIATIDALSNADPANANDNKQILARGRDAIARQKKGPNTVENILGAPGYLLGGPIGQHLLASGYKSAWNKISGVDSAADAGRRNEQLEKDIARAQAAQRKSGKPIQARWYDEITRDVSRVRAERESFSIGAAAYERELDKLTTEAMTGRGGRKQYSALNQALAQSRAEVGDVRAARAAVGRLDDKGLAQMVQVQGEQLNQFGSGTSQGRGARLLLLEAYRRASQQYGDSTSPQDVQALQQVRSAVFQSLDQSAQADLQLALGGAGSERDRQAAYAAAGRSYDQILKYARDRHDTALEREAIAAQRTIAASSYQDRVQGRDIYSQTRQAGTADPIRQARDAERVAQRNLRDARASGTNRDVQQAIKAVRDTRTQRVKAELDNLRSEGDLQTARGPQDPVSQARAAARQAQRTYSFMQAHRRQFSPTERRDALKAVIEANRAVDQSIIQAANDLLDVQTQLAQARDEGDPVAQAADALRGARAQRVDPNDPTSGPRKQLAILQARNQGKQAAQELAKARAEYTAALAGDDPRAQARAQIGVDQLAVSQARRGTAAWYQAKAQLIQDQRGLQQANADYAQARYEYLESLTTDPVKQARLQARAARAAVSGTTGAARLRALAAARNAQRNVIETQVQQREGDIDFNLTMEHISRQTAISQLQSLLKTHGLTKQVRRDILTKIKGLQDEANQDAQGFNLDVGNIKLPTIYDVRRALAPARQMVSDARASMRMSVSVGDITITDPAAADNFWQGMDRTLNTTVAAGARAALPR